VSLAPLMRGTGLSLRLAESPFPCTQHHFFLGATSTRASKSDRLGAPAAPAEDGCLLLKLEKSFKYVTHCLTTRLSGSLSFQSAAIR